MNLGDRSSGDCRFIKRREQSGERAREFGLDQGTRLGAWERRQAILQARKVDGDFLAEEIGPRRQELAELDETRSEFAESGGEPLARARPDRAAAACKQPGEPQERPSAGDGIQWKEGVVSREGQADPNQAHQVADTAQKPESGLDRVRDARPNG